MQNNQPFEMIFASELPAMLPTVFNFAFLILNYG